MSCSQSITIPPLSSMFFVSPLTSSPFLKLQSSVWSLKARNNKFGWALSLRCDALSKTNPAGLSTDREELLNDQVVTIKRQHGIVEGDDAQRLAIQQELSPTDIEGHVKRIREIFKSMDDGEISISPYDTAWVALAKDIDGAPQFPTSIQWIVDNQLPDGSWGDQTIYLAHDRIINTLACLIALHSWDVYPDKCQKGIPEVCHSAPGAPGICVCAPAIAFLKDNIWRLEHEKAEHMPIGFEVAFPALLEIARGYGIEVTGDSPALREIYAMRSLKLTKIPKEILHQMPTTLLHSLEGMEGLDWEKLLKLQSKDGSFLFSPASTAYALVQTKDLNCLRYLDNIVRKFNGGVPNVYPVDLFEHMWIVDRLQRLGISRYFEAEISECMTYIKRYWTDRGICWARNSEVQDIDDTAMAFRLLRLHGFDISADVFKNFEKNGEFFCFAGQSTQAVTGMYNLFRASQLKFPNEKILEDAREFSFKFLRDKQASNELLDKWIIAKDLPGEVTYALDIPWYASLPRIETRFYIEQYGGDDDVWIGKTLYRMPYVSNNLYLELAKWDYNNCQALHKSEWESVLRWYSIGNIGEFGVSQSSLLMAYFKAAAIMFEADKSRERLAWAKTIALVDAVSVEFGNEDVSYQERHNFVTNFKHSNQNPMYSIYYERTNHDNKRTRLIGRIQHTIEQLSLDALVTHGRDIRSQLDQTWEKWLRRWESEGDRYEGEAELLVCTIELCAGHSVNEETFSHPHSLFLMDMTNEICHRLGHLHTHNNAVHGIKNDSKRLVDLDADMEKVSELVFSNSSANINSHLKQTCLAVIKTFYYAAYCSLKEIDYHIQKVLFQKVD